MSDWAAARNVLCVRLDNLGDVLMTTPAIRALKEACPGRRVTLLASRASAALAPFLPHVDEVVCHDASWVKHAVPATPEAERGLAAALAERRFDAAVLFTVYSQSVLPAALLCFWAGIPLRLGYCRENPYGLLTDWVPETEPRQGIRHEVRRQLDLVGHAGCHAADARLVFAVRPQDRLRAERILRAAGVHAGEPLIVVHPGASAPSRRYPPESFAAAARSLAGRSRCRIVFTGSREEAPLVAAIRRQAGGRTVSLAGELELGELAAVIAAGAVLVSNNTGPVHIAAAVGTPVVDLYALTNPQHAPWMVPHRLLYRDVPCRFCYKSVCPESHNGCLRGVPPADVVSAVLELLAGRARPAPAHAQPGSPTAPLALAG